MTGKLPEIAVVLESTFPAAQERAQRIAAMIRGQLSMYEHPDALRLVIDDDRVSLRAPDGMSLGAASVDFSTLDLRPGSGNLSRKQPIARAIGLRAHSLVDATAGMGQDAFLLACMGYDVLAVERSPIVFALLEDGLARALADPQINDTLGGRLRLFHGDARQALADLPQQPDAIYVDPMFPPKRRASALPKKEIQLLRMAVGDDPDVGELLELARKVATQRVVVKRPTHSPPLERPSMSIEGKLVRYDVYVT